MIESCFYLAEEKIKEMCRHIQSDNSWFSRHGIVVYPKKNFFLLDKDAKTPLNEWNILCNGILVNENYVPVSIPCFQIPPRLKTDLDYKKCFLIEKMPGVSFTVCFKSGRSDSGTLKHTPIIHTKTAVSYLDKELDYLVDAIKNLKFSNMDYYKSFDFVYSNNLLYLYNVRAIYDLTEETESQLDQIATFLNVNRPFHKMMSSLDTIIEEVENHSQLEEGTDPKQWILRDFVRGERGELTFDIPRRKVVEKGSLKRLAPFWAKNQAWKIISEYPDTKAQFIRFGNALKDKISQVKELGQYYQKLSGHYNKQELVEEIQNEVPSWSAKIVINLMCIRDDLWDDYITNSIKKLPVKTLLFALELTD